MTRSSPIAKLTGGRPPYWRAIAMRMASSGETRWSELSAASAMASWTPLTRPLKALPRDP